MIKAGPDVLPSISAETQNVVLSSDAKETPLDELLLGPSGEYGELLVRDGPLLDKEEPLRVSSADVVGLLESLLNRPGLQLQCRNYTLTALMKLSTRFPDQSDRIKVRAACFLISLLCCQAYVTVPLGWELRADR